jgi:hypothetical protein
MSDLVERLRGTWSWPPSEVMAEAADRIEQLEAALKMFTCACADEHLCSVPDNCRNYLARAALGEERT